MELIAITLGEITRPLRMKRRRSIYFPDLIETLNKRYGFMEYPTQLVDMKPETGIVFSHGQFAAKQKQGKRTSLRLITIQTLALQDNGFMASGPDDTIHIDQFIDDVMSLFTDKYEYEFNPILPPRYLSRVEFLSDRQLLPNSDFSGLTKLINQQSELRFWMVGR